MFRADVYRVFIASPSDVGAERKVIARVIQEWNDLHSAEMSAVLLPIMWETHSVPEMGDRPQAIINRQLVPYGDILIGAFWTRIGSPTGVAESGTVEEIDQFRASGKPVMLYFSSRHSALDKMDHDQYQRLKAFRDKARKEGLVEDYKTVRELENKLRRQLMQTVRELRKAVGDAVALEGPAVVGAQPSPVAAREQLRATIGRYASEWAAKRDSTPVGVGNGKGILRRLASALLDHRASFDENADRRVVVALDEAVKECERLQQYVSGVARPEFYRAFWQAGDAVLRRLTEIVAAPGNILSDEPPLAITLSNGIGADFDAEDTRVAKMSVLAVSVVNEGPNPVVLAATDPVRAVMADGTTIPLPDTKHAVEDFYGPLASYNKRPLGPALGAGAGVVILLPRDPWRVLRSGDPARQCIAVEVLDSVGRIRAHTMLPPTLTRWFYQEPTYTGATDTQIVMPLRDRQATAQTGDLALTITTGEGEDFFPKETPISALEMLVIHVSNQGQRPFTLAKPNPLRLVLEDESEIRVPDDPSRDRERYKLAYCRGCPDDGRLAPGDEFAVLIPRQYWGTLRLDGEARCVAVRAVDVAGKTKAQVELPQELAHWFNDELVDQQKAIWEQQSQQ